MRVHPGWSVLNLYVCCEAYYIYVCRGNIIYRGNIYMQGPPACLPHSVQHPDRNTCSPFAAYCTEQRRLSSMSYSRWDGPLPCDMMSFTEILCCMLTGYQAIRLYGRLGCVVRTEHSFTVLKFHDAVKAVTCCCTSGCVPSHCAASTCQLGPLLQWHCGGLSWVWRRQAHALWFQDRG